MVRVTRRGLVAPVRRRERRMKRIRPTYPVRKEAFMSPRPTQHTFGETMFGHAELGDLRRTRRLVRLTDQLCKHPGGSLPDKLSSPKDLKALYRLCDRDEVTHAAVLTSVRQAVLQDIERRDDTILILHDGTELDFSAVKSLTGQLGQVGRGLKRGYLCHNSLAVTPEGRDVIGLVNQILHRRVRVPKKETLPQRRARQSRESRPAWSRPPWLAPPPCLRRPPPPPPPPPPHSA